MCKLPFANWTAFDTRIENTQLSNGRACLLSDEKESLFMGETNIKRQIRVLRGFYSRPLPNEELAPGQHLETYNHNIKKYIIRLNISIYTIFLVFVR